MGGSYIQKGTMEHKLYSIINRVLSHDDDRRFIYTTLAPILRPYMSTNQIINLLMVLYGIYSKMSTDDIKRVSSDAYYGTYAHTSVGLISPIWNKINNKKLQIQSPEN